MIQIPRSLLLALAFTSLTNIAAAEPIGRWWAGFGQGTFEYGIHNDSAGSDTVYIACGENSTNIDFKVGGVRAVPGSSILVNIGADEFELSTDEKGYFQTNSHVASDTFHALWGAIRSGEVMRVRLSTGQSTAFSLKGTTKVLPKEGCQTDFER